MKSGKKLPRLILYFLYSAARCSKPITLSSTNDRWNFLQFTVASGIRIRVEDTGCHHISLLILIGTTLQCVNSTYYARADVTRPPVKHASTVPHTSQHPTLPPFFHSYQLTWCSTEQYSRARGVSIVDSAASYLGYPPTRIT